MKKNILVVDDSATARMLFNVCLQGQDDYALLQASTWQEALKFAEDEALALVVFDYNMPEKVGTELAAMMRKVGVEAPFALMSANTQQHVMEEIESLGFIHLLEKPVSAEAVQSLLEKI
jgi:CheY-like chemotaxis protein